MKKLSNVLKRSYIFIIFIFLIFISFSLYQFWKHLYSTNEKQIKDSMILLILELKEVEEESPNGLYDIFTNKQIISDLKIENVGLNNFDIYIFDEDNNLEYSETSTINYKTNTKGSVILDIDDQEFALSEKIWFSNTVLDITLVKKIDDDLESLEIILSTFFIIIAIAILITILVSAYITRAVKKSLNNIMTLNENISLDNLKVIKPKNDF